jgi:hypothetical protein
MPSENTPVRNSWMCSVVIGDQNKPNNVDAMSLYLSEGFFGFGSPESNFDISSCADKDELNARILANYSEDKRPEKIAVDQYWKIAKEAKVGDRIFLTSYKGIFYACGEIVDGYKFSDANSKAGSVRARYRHSVGIRWDVKDSIFPWKAWLPVDFGIPAYEEWNSETAPAIERKLKAASVQNVILCGPPGTGKTYKSVPRAVEACLSPDDPFHQEISKVKDGAEDQKMYLYRQKYKELTSEGRIELVTFHQNYDYSDFIQGIRPVMGKSGGLAYALVRGPLWRIANSAMLSLEKGEDKGFALIIDEINRGNIAKIFGELITLIEPDKRDRPQGTGLRIPLLYGAGAVLESEDEVCKEFSGGKFCLPPNLRIIGTMNSSDKSVQRMDSALRRRFDFIDMPPRPEVLVDNPKLQRFLEVLNRRLEKVKPGSGCQVGHAWLSQDGVAFPCSHAKLLCGAFNNKVFPLLSEWFWNEPAQLRALMGGAFKYVDARTGIIERLDEKLLDPKKPGSAEHFLDFFVLDDDDSES